MYGIPNHLIYDYAPSYYHDTTRPKQQSAVANYYQAPLAMSSSNYHGQSVYLPVSTDTAISSTSEWPSSSQHPSQYAYSYQATNNESTSEISSSGIRTPDAQQQFFYVHPSSTIIHENVLIPALLPSSSPTTITAPTGSSSTSQMMLLQKRYSADFSDQYFPNCHQEQTYRQNDLTSKSSSDTTIGTFVSDASAAKPATTVIKDDDRYFQLRQLSREQLIRRVVELESQKLLQFRSDNTKDNQIQATDTRRSSSIVSPTIVKEEQKTDTVSETLDEDDVVEAETDEGDQKLENIPSNTQLCHWKNCQVQKPSLRELMLHICHAHVGSGKAFYYCEWRGCDRGPFRPFTKRHKMHNHIRTHTGERPFICEIEGCLKNFSRPDSLTMHMRTHTDQRNYVCYVRGCSKAYYHSRSLRKHLKSSHPTAILSSATRKQ